MLKFEILSAQRRGSAGPWHKVFAGWRRSKYFMSWSRMYPIVGRIILGPMQLKVHIPLGPSINPAIQPFYLQTASYQLKQYLGSQSRNL